MKNRHSTTYIVLVLMVLVVACTTRERDAEWLQQAEAYHKAGKVDSTLSCLYKINEARLSVEDSYAFFRLKYSNAFSNEPGAMEQIVQTAAYYEERGDTAHLEQMRKVLLSNYRFEQKYAEADSLLKRMYRDYTNRNDSTGVRWICSMKSALFEQQGKTDSALYYIDRLIAMDRSSRQVRYRYSQKADLLMDMGACAEAEACLDSAKAMAAREQDREYLYYLSERYRKLYTQQGRYDELLALLQESRQYMTRRDVASHNLYRAQVNELLHREDSARYYYQLVAQSENLFLASEALYHLSQYYLAADDAERTYHYHQDATGYIDQVFRAYQSQAKSNAFNELKLQSEIDNLKIGRQRHIIIILSLLLMMMTLAVGVAWLIQKHKRKVMVARQLQMEQENLLLWQAEELSLQREKANKLREVLIRKMEVFQKLPSLNDTLHEDNKAIRITDREWKEIRTLLDTEYEQFTSRLQAAVPDLTTTDLNFCCLVKINVSMQDLANIYCINKASVSRRKQRVKDKIGNELLQGLTLDEFLQRY